MQKLIKVWAEVSAGRCRLRWRDPYTGERVTVPTGQPASIGKKKMKELAALKAQELNNDRTLASAGTMTLKEWHTRYLATAKVGERTAAGMALTFKFAEEFWGPDRPLPELRTSDGRDFAVWLAARRYRGRPSSIATQYAHIRNEKIALARAVKERAQTGLSANPIADEKCGTIRSTKKWPTVGDDALGLILSKCSSDDWRMLFVLCRYAGTRQQEGVRIRWEDIVGVNWDTGAISEKSHIHIVKQLDSEGNTQADTTKRKERHTRVEARLAAYLVEQRRKHPKTYGPCDGLSSDPRTVSTLGSLICKRAGVKYPKPFHTLRKNLETEWFRKYPAPEVAYMLGNKIEVGFEFYFKSAVTEEPVAISPSLKITA